MTPKFLIPALLSCGLCFAAYAEVQSNKLASEPTETKNISGPAAEALNLARRIDKKVRAEMNAQGVTEKSKPKITADIARREIKPYMAQTTMARLVAGPHAWNKASPAEREKFSQALAEAVIRAYSAALTSYSKPTAKQDFSPPRTSTTTTNDPTRVEISSIITTDPSAPRLRVSYRFIKEDNAWKVYDINGEGVSLIKSYRSQIQPKLSQGQSLGAVAQELNQHNEKPKIHEE